jgi:hypothetical protein
MYCGVYREKIRVSLANRGLPNLLVDEAEKREIGRGWKKPLTLGADPY